jgi:hypothetical protein
VKQKKTKSHGLVLGLDVDIPDTSYDTTQTPQPSFADIEIAESQKETSFAPPEFPTNEELTKPIMRKKIDFNPLHCHKTVVLLTEALQKSVFSHKHEKKKLF